MIKEKETYQLNIYKHIIASQYFKINICEIFIPIIACITVRRLLKLKILRSDPNYSIELKSL